VRPAAPAQLPSLRRLIERHAGATGSARATAVLEGWYRAAGSFVRIAPREEAARIERALEGTADAGA
jgi:glutamate synthase domain-containing protein 3